MVQGIASRLSGLAKRIVDMMPWPMHEGQKRAWNSLCRFIAIIAGTQSGKTSWGPWWLAREIERCGDGDYIAVTATYDLFKLKMLPEMRAVFCDLLGWEYQAGDKVMVKGKSRIILRSANAPGGLESMTAKAAWLDECGQDDFTLEAWEAIQRRLSLSQGRVLMTTTPYNLGWLKSQVFDKWKGGHPDYEVVQFKSTMNPVFPAEEYERAKGVLPAWKHAMFYDGVFTRPAGLIYGDYVDSYPHLAMVKDEKTGEMVELEVGHLVKPFPIPKEWLRTVGVDFGAVNTALIWIAEEPNTGNYYVYREFPGHEDYDQSRTGPQHAKRALEYREPVKLWLGGAKSEDAQRLDWQMAGCPVCEPFITDVEAGIDRVIGLFKQGRLFVFDTCTGLRSELGTYSRELDASGEPLEKIKDKEKFHRLDALRYACSAFPLDRPVQKREEEETVDSRKLGSVAERLRRHLPTETEEYAV